MAEKIEIVYVKPNDPNNGLPNRDLFDERSAKFFEDFRKPYVGQIVFSKNQIDQLLDSDDLETEFENSEDLEIYGRAIWPTSLRNIPIGHDPNDNSVPIYGPETICSTSSGGVSLLRLEFFLAVKIDGNLISRKVEVLWEESKGFVCGTYYSGPIPPGSSKSSSNTEEQNNYQVDPSVMDFWAFNQSMQVFVVLKNPDAHDEWHAGIPFIKSHLAKLSEGKHEVTVELSYRLFPNEQEIELWAEDYGNGDDFVDSNRVVASMEEPTIHSHPIATGSFNITVGEGGVSQSTLPKRSCKMSDSEADKLEAILYEHMKKSPEWGARAKREEPLGIALKGPLEQLERRHKKDPFRYSQSFYATFYRSPLHGWSKEEPCVCFTLGAITASSSGIKSADKITVSRLFLDTVSMYSKD